MPVQKTPLAERNSNIGTNKTPSAKASSHNAKKDVEVPSSQSLESVANRIIQTYSKKRSHDEAGLAALPSARPNHILNLALSVIRDSMEEASESESDSDCEPTLAKWDANQIRTKINSLIRSGEYKVGQLQEKFHVSASAYRNFMNQSGPNSGTGSDTFSSATRFFTKRERQGIMRPRPKKAKTSSSSSSSSTSKSKSATKPEDASEYDVSDITLDGESREAVPIFDTCDDIRTKINAHLKLPKQTLAGLGRAMGETFSVAGDTAKTVRGTQISKFLSQRGPTAGAGSNVYYAAYVYFEKLRLKHKKPKSQKRREMEDVHPAKGCGREDVYGTRGFICHVSRMPVMDKYGVITMVPSGRC